MEQKWELRNRPREIQSGICQRSKGDIMEQRQSLQQMVLEQLGIHPCTKREKCLDTDLHSSWKLKQNGSEFKYETQIAKLLEDDRKENLDNPGYGDAFFDATQKIHEGKIHDPWKK